MSDAGDNGDLGAAFHELIAEVQSLESWVLDHPEALDDAQYRAESYRWIFSILHVALDCFLWGDPDNPRFAEIVGPHKKWGGDNSDAFYEYAPLDPQRTYRVSGHVDDAVYYSLTVYGGPNDGRYSERIVGSLNSGDLTPDGDGNFSCFLTPDPSSVDGPSIALASDAVCVITRDYLADPHNHQRTRWHIEAIDPPATWRNSPDAVARNLTRALTWIRDQKAITPIGLGTLNSIDPPYPVPTETFGWAAGDAAYAMGSFSLEPNEALVLHGRSPECVFWNMCLWNPHLHTYNYDYERVTINGTQTIAQADGSWTIVIAHEDPGHPNWVSTQGHAQGRIWFRWFLPESTPSEVAATVMPLDEVARDAG